MKLTNEALPQYKQLYEILKEQIQKGVYQPGDLLPSENALCQTYHLTRPTIRLGLSELVNDGFIKKMKGKGSIVQKQKTGIGILNIKGTTDSMPTGNLMTKVIDKPQIGPWKNSTEYDISNEEYEAGCITMSRLRLLNGQPIFYEETFLPNINLPRFTSRNFTDKSLFGILSKFYDLKITGGSQKIWAIPASKKMAGLLDTTRNKPILHLQKKYETNRPFFHFYTSIWCNTENYYLEGAL